MSMKVTVINRSFWPLYPVIGEALLRFAEGAAKKDYRVSVILQDRVSIKDELAETSRGAGVDFYPAKALTTSASGTLYRVFDALFFMLWAVLVSMVWLIAP